MATTPIQQAKSIFEVVTTYPTTTPSKAGQIFQYKGRLWHYMTQQEIDEVEWTGLVSVGFPAPLDKIEDMSIYLSNISIEKGYLINSRETQVFLNRTIVVNYLGLGLTNNIRLVTNLLTGGGPTAYTITSILNANLLTSLEDIGTRHALVIRNASLTNIIINDLFTQLPPTTKTATINVSDNPGSATCNPTIATAKGYTVVV